MDLSMILNTDAPSPTPSPRDMTHHVPASSRWSVDEMRSAVEILRDFPEKDAYPQTVYYESKYRPEEMDYASEQRYYGRQFAAPPHRPISPPRVPVRVAPPPPPPPQSAGASFSGLDLLFQADAMIQKHTSPDRRAVHPKKAQQPPIKASSRRRHEPVALDPEQDDDDDDVTTTPKRSSSSSPAYVRSGFWTRAEEEYAAALIFYFLRGALPIAEGTTLRKYLAEQLCCNRRRVSMKLATETIADKKIPRKVGASVFVALKPTPSDEDREQVLETLDRLRRDCFREVEEANASANQDDDEDTDDMRTPRQVALSTKKGDVSPLVLGAKNASPSEFSLLTTPARRKSSTKSSGKPTPSPKKRRSSVSSTPKTSPSNIKRRRPMIIRTGFETPEEEEFVTALVEYFTEGTLELNDDTRLVTYLCEQLDCSPKTLSMKLAPRRMGEQKFASNIGTMTYTRKDDDDASSEIFEAEAHVFELRQNWLQARESGDADTQPEGDIDDDEAEEKASVMSSPASTPSRRFKSERSATTSTPNSKSPTNAPRSYSRSGPWSRHEEEYAAGLIDCFFRGVLDITEGTTLRAFLTSRLNCNPMRISKKLASHTIADVKIPKKLGSATYVRRDGVSDAERRSAEEHLRHLEHLSLSEQHLKEDIVIGVMGSNKHARDEPKNEPIKEETYDRQYARYHDEQLEHYDPHYMPSQPRSRRQYSESSSPDYGASRASPGSSPFKMRRVIVDDYSHAPHERHHTHRRASPPSAYDHHDAAMRYQRVAY